MTPALAAALARLESAPAPALALAPAEGRVSTTRREAPPRNGVFRTLDRRDNRERGAAR